MENEARHAAGADSATGAGRMGPRPLVTNALYAIGGTGFYYACQLGVVVLLNKFAAPPITGQYFLALAVATPVVLFFGLELRSALVADAGNQFTFGAYGVLCRTMMLPAAVLLGGFVLWQGVLGSPASCLLILGGVFAAKIMWAVAEVGWGTYQRRERLDLLAATVGLRGLALIVPFTALLPLYHWLCAAGRIPPAYLADGTALSALLYAVGITAIWLAFDRPRVLDRRLWDLSWNWTAVWSLARQTFPLGLVALIVNLCDTLPRLIIESQPDGRAQLGYFGSLAYITLAGNLVVIQASAAAANRLSLYYRRDVRAFLRLGARLAGVAAAIGGGVLIAALLWGRWILSTLFTAEYARFETEFLIIVVAHCLALLTNVFGATTTQMRLFWVQVPVQVVTLVCTVTAAWALIPGANPVRGAAQTALVRAMVQFTLYTACVSLGLALRPRRVKQQPASDAS